MNPLSTRPNRWRPITVFNLLVGLFISLSALAQPAFLKEGLVAHYPFNGNANDESGNGRNLTPKVNIFTNDFLQNPSSALYFPYNTSIQVPYFPRVTTDSFTVSIWANYLRQPSGNTWPFVFAKYGSFSIGSEKTDLNTHNGGWIFYANSGSGPVSIVFGKFTTGEWVNLALTYNRSSFVMYLNGVEVGRGDSIGLIENNNPFVIGGNGWVGPEQSWTGAIDNLRIYRRALSDGEVKALYDYESTPPQNNLNPRTATATAQVVNGFVVGATIIDGGYGYVSNPVVTITGGGGTGAKATALQVDGVVTSITITNPGIGYTSAPTIIIAPPPFPPKKATATSQIVNGFVVGTKITDGGFGYDSPPTVLLVGGGGSGATAVATVANGVVTAITITNPGTGYTSVPIVRIASPPFAPKLGIETSKVFVRMSVVLGRKYQLEASTDLNTWTTTGPAFIAQDEELAQEFDVNQVGRYFRINQVP